MKLNSFKQFLVKETKEVYFTFGRMNPPTVGHGKLLDKLAEAANGIPYKVFLSHSQDSTKNPLLYEEKIKVARKFFPKHGRSIIQTENIRDILQAATHLYEDGYKKITLIVGEDRTHEFDILLNKYNGKESRHGFYVFESIKVKSAGMRDPDSEGVGGMSASKLREAASSGNFVQFAQGVPKNVSNSDTKKLFNDVRNGLGLTEEKTPRKIPMIKSVSDIREKYVQGSLFKVGDQVILKSNDELVEIAILGSNYLIVETSGGKRLRKWLDDVEKLNT